MKLLKFSFDHLRMFENGVFELDLFAENRVPKGDESVFHLFKSTYTNNTIAFAGINASGKTMSLALTDLALDFVSGLSLNDPFEKDYFIDLFEDTTFFRGLIWVEGDLFLLKSFIRIEEKPASISATGKDFVIEEEWIFKLPTTLSRKDLTGSLETLAHKGTEFATRSCEDARTRKLLGSGRSIFFNLSDEESLSLRLEADESNRLPNGIENATNLLQVFDSTIRSISKDEKTDSYDLRIEGRDDPLTLSLRQIGDVLSSGTIKGYEIAQCILDAIKNGTYLLIDEIENHLNKTLVQMIVNLFSDAETNPNGATLIFTTHYAEILDCIHRKDCVYFFVRNKDGKISKVKYSERVGRIENKKSEVFVSNHIKGTAPKYTEVSYFRNLVREVAHADR